MNKIVFASGNENKVKEVRAILTNTEILSLKDINFADEIVEDGNSLIENSLIKSRTVYEFLKAQGTPMPVLADDAGIFVNALNGEPGIYSARYSATKDQPATSASNRKKMLENMEGITDRRAYFGCCMSLYNGEGNIEIGVGRCYGEISFAESGDTGFGYDSIFYSYDLEAKFSEVSDEEKNSVSHRRRALQDLEKHHKLKVMAVNEETFNNLKEPEFANGFARTLNINVDDYICFNNNHSKMFMELKSNAELLLAD